MHRWDGLSLITYILPYGRSRSICFTLPFPANGNEIEFVRILYRPGAGFWVTLRRNGEEDHDTFMFPISMKGRTQSLKLHNNWREILVALKACVSTL